MPFKSEAQRRFMYAKHPEIAKRWSKKYGEGEDLPERKKEKPRHRAARDKDLNSLWGMK